MKPWIENGEMVNMWQCDATRQYSVSSSLDYTHAKYKMSKSQCSTGKCVNCVGEVSDSTETRFVALKYVNKKLPHVLCRMPRMWSRNTKKKCRALCWRRGSHRAPNEHERPCDEFSIRQFSNLVPFWAIARSFQRQISVSEPPTQQSYYF